MADDNFNDSTSKNKFTKFMRNMRKSSTSSQAPTIIEDEVDEDFADEDSKMNPFLRRHSKSSMKNGISHHGSTSSLDTLAAPFRQSMKNLAHKLSSKKINKDASDLPPKSHYTLNRKSANFEDDKFDTVSLKSTKKGSFFLSKGDDSKTSLMSKLNPFSNKNTPDSTNKHNKNSSIGNNKSAINELLASTNRLSVSEFDIRGSPNPNVKLNKSPESTTPLSPTNKIISHPLPLDENKQHEFSQQKLTTIQLMHQQAQIQLQDYKIEYEKNQSEQNATNVESQTKVVRRLESQLSQTSPIVTDLPTSNIDSSLQMPPPSTTVVPIAIVGNNRNNNAAAAMTSSNRKSNCTETSASSLDDKEDSSSSSCGLPPHAHHRPPPHYSQQPNRNLKGKISMLASSSLARSQSDSCKKRNEKFSLQMALRNSVSSGDVTNLPDNTNSIGKRLADKLSRSHSKSQGGTSDGTDQLHPLAEEHSSSSLDVSNSTTSMSGHKNLSQQSVNIIPMDDDVGLDDNMSREVGPFSKFEDIHKRPAHLAVFLKYLLSNNDPASLLFLLVTDNYSQGTSKDMKRWAYEIFTSFLTERAPLKLNIDTSVMEIVSEVMSGRMEKEEKLGVLFDGARSIVLPFVKEQLGDFRSKLSLGLGSFYGVQDLKECNDPASEMYVIEKQLFSTFVTLLTEQNEPSPTICSALMTFFRSINFTPSNTYIEKITPFLYKEKTKFGVFTKSTKKTSSQVMDHNLQQQQYTCITYCHLCQHLIGGLGYQGYQCQRCEQNFHKQCINNIREKCTSRKVDRSKTTPNILRKKISMKSDSKMPRAMSLISIKDSTTVPTHNKSFLGFKKEKDPSPLSLTSTNLSVPIVNPATSTTSSFSSSSSSAPHPNSSSLSSSTTKLTRDDSMKSIHNSDDGGSERGTRGGGGGPYIDTTRNISPELDDDTSEFYDPVTKTFPNSHIPALSNNQPIMVDYDSDYEAELEVPQLESYVPRECLKKMKPKEKKRQNVINELFHTERSHVRNLKVMYNVIFLRMQQSYPKEFVDLLFPNLDQIIEVHVELNNKFKDKKKGSENFVVDNFADILVDHFTKEKGDRFKEVCATFCEKQSQALDKLKTKQKKDQKLAAFLQEMASVPLCRRFELKDLLPTAMQRLTKYPLFISSLLKYTQPDTDEYRDLEVALEGSRSVLNHVNRAVQRYENHLKLVDMQKRLDKKSIETSTFSNINEYRNLDLTRHTLICDGSLTWRINKERILPIHLVLLEDILLLMQKQDDKLVLKCQSMLLVPGRSDTRMNHSPIVKLVNLLIKQAAFDKTAFFLVNNADQSPQIYELVASSKEEKDKWCKQINDALEAYRLANPEIWKDSLIKHTTASAHRPNHHHSQEQPPLQLESMPIPASPTTPTKPPTSLPSLSIVPTDPSFSNTDMEPQPLRLSETSPDIMVSSVSKELHHDDNLHALRFDDDDEDGDVIDVEKSLEKKRETDKYIRELLYAKKTLVAELHKRSSNIENYNLSSSADPLPSSDRTSLIHKNLPQQQQEQEQQIVALLNNFNQLFDKLNIPHINQQLNRSSNPPINNQSTSTDNQSIEQMQNPDSITFVDPQTSTSSHGLLGNDNDHEFSQSSAVHDEEVEHNDGDNSQHDTDQRPMNEDTDDNETTINYDATNLSKDVLSAFESSEVMKNGNDDDNERHDGDETNIKDVKSTNDAAAAAGDAGDDWRENYDKLLDFCYGMHDKLNNMLSSMSNGKGTHLHNNNNNNNNNKNINNKWTLHEEPMQQINKFNSNNDDINDNTDDDNNDCTDKSENGVISDGNNNMDDEVATATSTASTTTTTNTTNNNAEIDNSHNESNNNNDTGADENLDSDDLTPTNQSKVINFN